MKIVKFPRDLVGKVIIINYAGFPGEETILFVSKVIKSSDKYSYETNRYDNNKWNALITTANGIQQTIVDVDLLKSIISLEENMNWCVLP